MNADEFKLLFDSSREEDKLRLREPADDAVWLDVILRFPELEAEVLKNNTISGIVLEALAKSCDPDIRFEVAMKRRNTIGTFELLSLDVDASVRHRIACNPKTPKDILQRLASDADDIVSKAALKRI